MATKEYRGYEIRNRTGGWQDYFIVHGERVRWGTLDEIKADVDHIHEYGNLPPRKRGYS